VSELGSLTFSCAPLYVFFCFFLTKPSLCPLLVYLTDFDRGWFQGAQVRAAFRVAFTTSGCGTLYAVSTQAPCPFSSSFLLVNSYLILRWKT